MHLLFVVAESIGVAVRLVGVDDAADGGKATMEFIRYLPNGFPVNLVLIYYIYPCLMG